jgi:hypothetical protein
MKIFLFPFLQRLTTFNGSKNPTIFDQTRKFTLIIEGPVFLIDCDPGAEGGIKMLNPEYHSLNTFYAKQTQFWKN